MIDGVRYIGLPRLIEPKLASGMTGGIGRLKDIADVVELVRAANLSFDFAAKIDPYVRDKFVEIVRGVEVDNVDHGSIPD